MEPISKGILGEVPITPGFHSSRRQQQYLHHTVLGEME